MFWFMADTAGDKFQFTAYLERQPKPYRGRFRIASSSKKENDMKKIIPLVSLSLLFAASVLAQGTSTTASTTSAATTKATTTAKRGPVFRPTKDQITQVQKMLIEKKLYSGQATGSYNNETRTGIKSFQKDNGLKETGTLNRATLEKLGVELTTSQKAIPVSPNSFASTATTASKSSSTSSSSKTTSDSAPKKTIFRATGDQVKAAQKLLKTGTFYTGEESGKLDTATRDGLKKYQDANGLKVTGTLNQVTLEKMGIELTENQKGSSPAASTKSTPK
jgi:peptidoglycan hydrolase-like protein with peptidoglycan-binding domain